MSLSPGIDYGCCANVRCKDRFSIFTANSEKHEDRLIVAFHEWLMRGVLTASVHCRLYLILEGHALSCPKYLGADGAAPSNSKITPTAVRPALSLPGASTT